MEIIDNCFGSLERDFRIWAWYCRHFDRRRIVDRAYFYASCQKCGEVARGYLNHKNWRSLGIPERTFQHALKKVKNYFSAR